MTFRPRFPSLLALSLVAALATPVGAATFDTYDVTGSRRLGDFAFGALEGTLRLEAGGSMLDADFFEIPGPSFGPGQALFGGPPSLFDGTYSELNLFLISFWSFEGTSDQASASGRGIRLFFGLLVFGSFNSNSFTVEFSGVFAGQVGTAPTTPRDASAGSAWRPERFAEARRRRPMVAVS